MAIAPELSCGTLRRQFANQAAPVAAQLAAGVRVLNLDADLKAGSLVFSHSICANGVSTPAKLFDQLGAWLAANPSETLVLYYDDNAKRGDEAVEEQVRYYQAR